MVLWDTEFAAYSPTEFTSSTVLGPNGKNHHGPIHVIYSKKRLL
jgi:hypothetical protein